MIFQTIYADFPWNETGGNTRGAQYHYRVMKPKALLVEARRMRVLVDTDCCHGYYWATNTNLKLALACMEATGFRYLTMRTWTKRRMGIGQYFRGKTEHLLFGVIGSAFMPPNAGKLTTEIIPPLGWKPKRHSEKPPMYADIERQSPGPNRVELFCRGDAAPGWQAAGLECSQALGEDIADGVCRLVEL